MSRRPAPKGPRVKGSRGPKLPPAAPPHSVLSFPNQLGGQLAAAGLLVLPFSGLVQCDLSP